MMQDQTGHSEVPRVRPVPSLSHFKKMMGPYGLYQHATLREPLLSEGYCTDDNARALHLLIVWQSLATADQPPELAELIERCWKFITAAEEQPGIFYNFRSADGQWLTPGRSDDMYARLFRMLSAVVAQDVVGQRQAEAKNMLSRLLTQFQRFTAARARAEIVVALASLPAATRLELHVLPIIELELQELARLWQANATPAWPWFEPTMTYANALLPHSFWVGNQLLNQAEYTEIFEQSKDFLITTTIKEGVFIPIGSNGWYPRGGVASRDNQQAIEAGTTWDFFNDYLHQDPTALPVATAAAPYLWFLGHNDHHLRLVDEADGACLDGLFIAGPNPNCGAESMVAYLWSVIRLGDAPGLVRTYIQQARS